MQTVTFKATILFEKYYNDDSHYGVYNFITSDDIPEYKEYNLNNNSFDKKSDEHKKLAALAGVCQQLSVGADYDITAILEYNEKYKQYQYKPVNIVSKMPKSKDEQARFLKAIITEKQTETLLSVYPNIVEDIANGKDNVDVKKLKGIGETTYAKIREKVVDNYVISDLLSFLAPYGITYKMICKMLKLEKNPVLLQKQIQDNPYILIKVRGLGFHTVDVIAQKINPSIINSAKRVYAFINIFFNELAEGNGDTWVTTDVLRSNATNMIPEALEYYDKVIDFEREKETVLHFNKNYVGLKYYFEAESEIYKLLTEDFTKVPAIKVNEKAITCGIEKAETDQGFSLTEEQLSVVHNCLNSQVNIIVGKAGVGKSSVCRTILEIYKANRNSISCVAFSAKAAQRITEATGFPAQTIHRFLGANQQDGFKYNRNKKIENLDVLLIDECSMINVSLFRSLFIALPFNVKIIMCGDNRQLPPIGAGNVFNDLLYKTDKIQVNRLTKVLRQAQKSGILTDANKIRDGEMPISYPEPKITNGELQDMTYMFRNEREKLNSIAINAFMKAVQDDNFNTKDTVIITPRRKDCQNSANEINTQITQMLFKANNNHMQHGDKKFYVGSKVMHIKNNAEKNVFNGEVGYVININGTYEGSKGFQTLEVEYEMNGRTKVIEYNQKDLEELDLAYALTCHKLQGDAAKNVIIIIDMTHYTLLDTCMLYTAITRSKKRCLLLAEPMAFKICMQNNKSKEKNTWLMMC